VHVLDGQARPVAAVAAGGAIGALLRWAVGLGIHGPLGTVLVNVVGCFAIGVLLQVVTTRPTPPLLRPFLATGVLGGFTTFSTFAVDAQHLLLGGEAAWGVAYLAGTLLAALAATWLGMRVARWSR
jgi:fluoride exporter